MATPVLMPRQGQSVESCILVEWKVAAGDSIEEGAPVAEIETDKATFEVEAPASGTMVELFFEEGDDIPVLTHIAAIGDAGEDVSSLRPEGDAPAASEPAEKTEAASPAPAAPAAAPAAAAAVASAPADGAGVSPRARKAATDKGVNVSAVAGSGPGGRVIERDVLAAATAQPGISPASREAIASGQAAAPVRGSGPAGRVLTGDLQSPGSGAAPAIPVMETKEIPLSGIRKIIAKRMVQSLSTTAQLTMTRSFNATAIQTYRQKVKAHGEAFGLPNVTINDMIVYATAQTLRRHPELNAHFLGDKILQHGQVNLGIAVDTPRGLMVPVLNGAEQLPLSEVSARVKPLAMSCIEGNVSPDMLSGGTFTITNLGSLGVESFTPVLNAPEVAILGVNGLFMKPIKTAQGVEHVEAMNLSLTIDHQALDGAPGARFLKDLCDALENFELIL